MDLAEAGDRPPHSARGGSGRVILLCVVLVGLLWRLGAGACPNLPQRRPGPMSAVSGGAEYQRFFSRAPARSGSLWQIWTHPRPGRHHKPHAPHSDTPRITFLVRRTHCLLRLFQSATLLHPPLYEKRERSGGLRSVADGKGRSRRGWAGGRGDPAAQKGGQAHAFTFHPVLLSSRSVTMSLSHQNRRFGAGDRRGGAERMGAGRGGAHGAALPGVVLGPPTSSCRSGPTDRDSR